MGRQVLIAWRVFNVDFLKICEFVGLRNNFPLGFGALGRYTPSGVAWLFPGKENDLPREVAFCVQNLDFDEILTFL